MKEFLITATVAILLIAALQYMAGAPYRSLKTRDVLPCELHRTRGEEIYPCKSVEGYDIIGRGVGVAPGRFTPGDFPEEMPNPELTPIGFDIRAASYGDLKFQSAKALILNGFDGQQIARLDYATQKVSCQMGPCEQVIEYFLRAADYWLRVKWCEEPRK